MGVNKLKRPTMENLNEKQRKHLIDILLSSGIKRTNLSDRINSIDPSENAHFSENMTDLFLLDEKIDSIKKALIKNEITF